MLPQGRHELRVGADLAESLALEVWELAGSASALPGECDENLLLTTREGRAEYVLKVMHPEREPDLVDLQCRALQHVAERAPGLRVPRVVPARSGGSVVRVDLPDGTSRQVWMLTYLRGTTLAQAVPREPELLESLGGLLGDLTAALATFEHPAAVRDFKWDLTRAGWIGEHLDAIVGPGRRLLVERFLALFSSEVLPVLPRLRRSVIHGDANDHNVVIGDPLPGPRAVTGLIDFGDLHYGLTVAELAVGAAYAILGERDPLTAATRVVAGYHAAFPLLEIEIDALFPLIAMRLAVSVTNSALGKAHNPDDPYVSVSEAPAWEALERLAGLHPRFARYAFRVACSFPASPASEDVARFLRASRPAQVLESDLKVCSSLVLDLSVGSPFLGADPRSTETARLTASIEGAMREANAEVGIGRYDEARILYESPLFAGEDERRTIHLGIDLFVAPGSPVHAPLDGVVHLLANNQAPQDYGPLVILEHRTDDGLPFFTLYGHLTEETLTELAVGQRVVPGQRLGWVGAPPTNGDWAPHVHVQLIVDLLERGADFPGVAYPSQRAIWTSLSPDPNLLLGIPPESFPAPPRSTSELREARGRLLGRSLSLSYRRPLQIVRGWKAFLYDETGRRFLDLYNNVPLVGHGHPRVVAAAQRQLGILNTNTRYLHENVLRYAERLTALMPESLSVCLFVSSGSEANELALRLARATTGADDVIVLEHAYHGHTTTLVDVSPYKFDGPGGRGRKPWVHVAPLPDVYRGPYRAEDPEAGVTYARHVGEALGGRRMAFLAETLPSVGGQVVLPPGYLAEAYRLVREAGGVCIADEVQVGFGRLGTHFWGFETQGVVPDIVVMGKPIGNAFPLAAVVTTPEIAAAFDNGMEFFSTFGGNPVACAAGLAVLDVLRDERLQERALEVGNHVLDGLRRLQARHALIGDVRGSGLFLGVDLVTDRGTRSPAPAQARYVVNRLRERGVLTGTDGPHHNVIKLRPPLVLSRDEADVFLEKLDEVLGEDGAKPEA